MFKHLSSKCKALTSSPSIKKKIKKNKKRKEKKERKKERRNNLLLGKLSPSSGINERQKLDLCISLLINSY
jgi:hypothetical protein